MHVTQNLGIQDPKFDDYYLLRYLVSEYNNVHKAISKFTEYIKFRKEVNIDNIHDWDWTKATIIERYYQCGYYFTDKEQRPVYIEFPGAADFDAILTNYSVDEVFKLFSFQWELNERIIQPIAS